jgi:hypothetical protein
MKCSKFAQICSKHALNYTTFVNIQKGQKMAKWPNHFISGKQFQKRPNLADLAFNVKLYFHLLGQFRLLLL